MRSPGFSPALSAGEPGSTSPITTWSLRAWLGSSMTPSIAPRRVVVLLPAFNSPRTGSRRSMRQTMLTPEFGAVVHSSSSLESNTRPMIGMRHDRRQADAQHAALRRDHRTARIAVIQQGVDLEPHGPIAAGRADDPRVERVAGELAAHVADQSDPGPQFRLRRRLLPGRSTSVPWRRSSTAPRPAARAAPAVSPRAGCRRAA